MDPSSLHLYNKIDKFSKEFDNENTNLNQYKATDDHNEKLIHEFIDSYLFDRGAQPKSLLSSANSRSPRPGKTTSPQYTSVASSQGS